MMRLESSSNIPAVRPAKAQEQTSAFKAHPIEMRHQAIAEFDRDVGSSVSRHPKRAEFLSAANLLLRHSEFGASLKLLRDILRTDPFDTQAIRTMAQAYLGLGESSTAELLLGQLVKMDDRSEHLVEFADCLYLLGKDHEALKHYLMALRGLDENSSALFSIYKNIGNIFVRSHDFESAEENYNKAHVLNQNSAALLVNYGTLEIQRQNWERAGQRFREALQLEARNDRAWVGLAIVHRQFGDIDLSWGNLDQALDVNPENETALQLVLSWAVKDQRCEFAIRRLQDFLGRQDDNLEMSLALAQLFYVTSRLPEARIEIERTLALDPTLKSGLELLTLIENEATGFHEN